MTPLSPADACVTNLLTTVIVSQQSYGDDNKQHTSQQQKLYNSKLFASVQAELCQEERDIGMRALASQSELSYNQCLRRSGGARRGPALMVRRPSGAGAPRPHSAAASPGAAADQQPNLRARPP